MRGAGTRRGPKAPAASRSNAAAPVASLARSALAPLGLIPALLAVAVATAPAAARTIDVHPRGPASHPLQRAINRASPGDRIRVHHGRYRESVVVPKRLEIFAARDERRPVIDARCRASVVIDVEANRVSLDGLEVIGSADAFTVNFVNIGSGRVNDLRLANTCGEALYGVNVYGKGAIRITNNHARGYRDAGYYVGSIGSTGQGSLLIRGNTASGNNRGVIVEDSAGVDIRVVDNVLNRNGIGGEGIPSGIFVHNSDGMLFTGNRADDNGVYGIHVDATSDGNVLRGNRAAGNGTADFFDEGAGTCGSGNSFPLPAC
ncbi:MAG: right-handed parallel beta-helix repeat-containing protein [Thermoleophilia bacterium]|nr:right-handed parallel beta-helix repeat-containing protein [Thermoleophilia bacterium]